MTTSPTVGIADNEICTVAQALGMRVLVSEGHTVALDGGCIATPRRRLESFVTVIIMMRVMWSWNLVRE